MNNDDKLLQKNESIMLYEVILSNSNTELNQYSNPSDYSNHSNHSDKLNQRGHVKLENLLNVSLLKKFSQNIRIELQKYSGITNKVIRENGKCIIFHGIGRIDYSPIEINF